MCSNANNFKKHTVGRGKPRYSGPGKCTWCGEFVNGRTRNKNVMASRMATHLKVCPVFQEILENNNVYLHQNAPALLILDISHDLGGLQYSFST